MINFLRFINVERISFWIGFAAATIFWWLAVKFWPILKEWAKQLKKSYQSAKQGVKANIADRHRADTLKYAQSLHLAAPLFSLDEITIQPRLLAPPIPIEPNQEPPTEDIVSQTIPFMPDWPELASAYGAHTLSLEEALQGDVNILIVGPPGSGKSFALAQFASALARDQIEDEHLSDLEPLFVHAADLNLPIEMESPLDAIINALVKQASTLSAPRLPNFIRTTFETGHAMLLLDGLDELAPDALAEAVAYLIDLLRMYPQTRVVAAANSKHNGGLTKYGFVPLPMAVWGPRQQAHFAQQWGELWSRYIDVEARDDYISVEPLLLNSWLLNQASAISPLEFTLQIWAAYAGDVRGPTLSDALEAYLRRMSVGIPKAQAALERFAYQAVLSRKASFTESEANLWSADIYPEGAISDASFSDKDDHRGEITVQRILPDLIDSGIFVQRTEDRLSFNHPMLPGYLAGRALSKVDNEDIFSQPAWPVRDLAICFNASHQDLSLQANQIFAQNDDPLHRGEVFVTNWLREIPLDAPWRRSILGKFSNLLSDGSIPLGARTRLLTGLASTKDPDISTLFRHLLKSTTVSVRQLAALGSGFQRDTQAVNMLIQLLDDQPVVNRAACLALVNIGTQPALEAIANALLQGSEELRHAAAGAFANHPEEGYPTLREATTIDDLLVRRSAISGLRRIREPWSIQILEEMQIEDAQWVVKNAAAQAVEDINNPDMHIPQALAALAELPWLISYAAERGVGVSPGDPARQMVKQVLEQGSVEEQLAALYQIQRRGFGDVFPAIFNQLLNDDIELRETAFNTIWYLAACGEEIPSPIQYGLG